MESLKNMCFDRFLMDVGETFFVVVCVCVCRTVVMVLCVMMDITSD